MQAAAGSRRAPAREDDVKKIALLIAGAALLAGCAAHGFRSDFAFAGRLAREGLWQEAHFRLLKAKAAGNDSAALHNNLAVVLEALGRFEEARREYEAAVKLDPRSEQIRGNFEKFKKNQEKAAHETK